MRTPGVGPGSQAWGACMMPLHYVRSDVVFRRFANGIDAHVVPKQAARTREGRRDASLFAAAGLTTQKGGAQPFPCVPGPGGAAERPRPPISARTGGARSGPVRGLFEPRSPRVRPICGQAGIARAHIRTATTVRGTPDGTGDQTPNTDAKVVQKTPFDCTSVTCAFSSGDDFLQTSLMQ